MLKSQFARTATMAATVSLVAIGTLQAGPSLTINGPGVQTNLSVPQTAENDFFELSDPYYRVTEDFNDYDVAKNSADQNDIFTSSLVGEFEAEVYGNGGACGSNGFSCTEGLAILDKTESPFTGRFSAPEASGQWLDSMDAREMSYTNTTGTFYNAVGFYMTDPNDANGRFDIGGSSFFFDDVFGSALGNGKAFYVTLTDASGIDGFSIYSNNRNDGIGIDNFTLAYVPEPGTLALLGLGLAGLGAARRRRA